MINWVETLYSSLLEILSYQNQLHSIPYNTYNMANHYRSDLFHNKLEQKAFQLRYHYPLASPASLSELKDVAEFFTRKKGQLLKGKKLTKNFAYLEAAQALASGDVATWPFAYNNLWAVSSKLNSGDPQQSFAISATPGGTPYHGAYASRSLMIAKIMRLLFGFYVL